MEISPSDDEMSSKCDIKASKLRNEGNAFYNQRIFHEALLKYNQSLCFAETNEILALAYANRSAVYLEMEYFEQCLNNIRLAREHNYPIEKIKTLDDREVKCIQMKKYLPRIQEDPFDYFELSYDANEKIPMIIDGLKLDSDENFGRKIVAKQSLKVGDVICIESPYFQMRDFGDPDIKFNICSHCLIDNNMNLLPCAGCTNTMFCNKGCEKIAQQQYHKYMCRESSCESSCDDYLKILFLKALDVMNGSIDDLQQLFEECLKSPKTIFDFDFSNQNDPDYSKNQLRAALSLARRKTFFPFPFDLKVFDVIGFQPKHEQFIRTFLNHLFQIKGDASVDIAAWEFGGSNAQIFGSSTYLLSALVNHACAPNVQRNVNKNNMCLIVIRPIKKGEQLFDNYGPHFIKGSVSKRREFLNSYSFECNCEACLDPETYKVNPIKEKYVYDNMTTLNKILQQRGLKYFMSNFAQMLQKLHSQKNYTSLEYQSMLYAFRCFLCYISNIYKLNRN